MRLLPAASGAVAARLANKKVFDPAKRSAHVSLVNGEPTVRLASGKSVTLMAVDVTPKTLATATDPALTTKLTKYAPYLRKSTGPAKTATQIVAPAVDYRSLQSPVKDQKTFGTCSAFATIAGVEWFIKRAWNAASDASEADAWYQTHHGTCEGQGVFLHDMAESLKLKSVCHEAAKPYSGSASDCAGVNSQCEASRRFGIASYGTYWGIPYKASHPADTDFADDTNLLESLLDLGFPVTIHVAMLGNGWYDGTAESGVIDREQNDNWYYGQHAMLLVGYNQAGGYFIAKNSWGTDFGHAGYAYLSYLYLQTTAQMAVVITGVRNPG